MEGDSVFPAIDALSSQLSVQREGTKGYEIYFSCDTTLSILTVLSSPLTCRVLQTRPAIMFRLYCEAKARYATVSETCCSIVSLRSHAASMSQKTSKRQALRILIRSNCTGRS